MHLDNCSTSAEENRFQFGDPSMDRSFSACFLSRSIREDALETTSLARTSRKAEATVSISCVTTLASRKSRDYGEFPIPLPILSMAALLTAFDY